MNYLRYNRYGIRYLQVWFNNHQELIAIDTSNIDVLEFKESYVQIKNFLQPFKNGLINLTTPLSLIHSNFEKGFAYEIRRAEKELITCSELTQLDISALEEIYNIYKTFCFAKKIAPISFEIFLIYLRAKTLKITVSIKENIHLQYHIYFSGEQELVLLASFPGKESNKVKNSIVGYANRYLHWFDMQQANLQGKLRYNLGGIGNTNDPSTKGIVNFKMEMNPLHQFYYQGLIPISLRGRLYLAARNFLKKYV